jgi:hypothetical protein
VWRVWKWSPEDQVEVGGRERVVLRMGSFERCEAFVVEVWRGVWWVSCVPFCGGRMCDDERVYVGDER